MKRLIVDKNFQQPYSSKMQLSSFRELKQTLKSVPDCSSIRNSSSLSNYSEMSEEHQDARQLKNIRSTSKNGQSNSGRSRQDSGSAQRREEIVMLAKKIHRLLASKQNISHHVANSLRVKSYNKERAVQIGEIVAKSFSDYISMAKSLHRLLIDSYQPQSSRQAQIIHLNRSLSKYKLENAHQFQTITRLKQEIYSLKSINEQKDESDTLKDKTIIDHIYQQQNAEIVARCQEEVSNVMRKMEKVQNQAYQKLAKHQERLIELGRIRNQLLLERRKLPKQFDMSPLKPHQSSQSTTRSSFPIPIPNQEVYLKYKYISDQQQEEISRLSQIILHQSQQITVRKALYDQLLTKTLNLQKEIFFITAKSKDQEKSENSSSLRIFQLNSTFQRLKSQI